MAKKKVNQYSPVRYVECSTPWEFMRSLELSGDLLKCGTWLFRGHSSNSYKLTPTVLRDAESDQIKHALGDNSVLRAYSEQQHTNAYQVLAELEMLLRFVYAVDYAGLSIPGATSILVDYLLEYRQRVWSLLHSVEILRLNGGEIPQFESFEPWPISPAYQLLALARHSGIPTRLLDWSFTPTIAAYFACASAAQRRPRRNDKVCVWALNPVLHSLEGTDGGGPLIPWVKVFKEGNRNMVVQNAIFTTVATRFESMLQPVDKRPIDKIALEQLTRIDDEDIHRKFDGCLICVRLPARMAITVLRYLRSIGVSRATMFPNHSEIMTDFAENFACERAVSIVKQNKYGDTLDGFSKPKQNTR